MSEFSDSLHIYDETIDNVKTVLMKLKIPSVIMGRNERTITVLMGWEDKSKVYTEFKVLDYSYAEDHGFRLKFYNKSSKEFAQIECSWDDPEDFDLSPDQIETPVITKDYEQILEKEEIISHTEKVELKRLVDNFDGTDWKSREAIVKKICDVLGLFQYEWLSYEDFFYSIDSYKKEYPDLQLINC